MTSFIARGALDDAAVKGRLDEEMRLAREHGVQYWVLVERSSGESVGCCGLRPRGETRAVYELGFHICADHWAKGYATEAALAVIEHGFDVLGAASLFAGHHPDNVASRRTLEKLGFRHTHDEPYAPSGLEHPSYTLDRRTRFSAP